mmetsp:Transcript_7172/g.15599  ORF Transcript_7172/g.15599 Transcript_7172/m.15599 type:complete len:367 (+) Transcript_7172:76-1176(+)
MTAEDAADSVSARIAAVQAKLQQLRDGSSGARKRESPTEGGGTAPEKKPRLEDLLGMAPPLTAFALSALQLPRGEAGGVAPQASSSPSMQTGASGTQPAGPAAQVTRALHVEQTAPPCTDLALPRGPLVEVRPPTMTTVACTDSSSGPTPIDAEEDSRTAQWAQVFGMLLQAGLEEKATDYAKSLKQSQENGRDVMRQYREMVACESQLLASAYEESVQAHLMAQIQMQAQLEVQTQGAQMQADIQTAHLAAAAAVAAAETKMGRPKKFPRRHGMPECQYYMRTGDCHYGATCKWDHPDRTPKTTNERGFPIRPDQESCQFYMRTGDCKFGQTCKWNHPEGVPGQARAATSTQVVTINGKVLTVTP